ncbi:MAG: DUF6531 domain-containing protein, partial [Actinomycetota bacterium]
MGVATEGDDVSPWDDLFVRTSGTGSFQRANQSWMDFTSDPRMDVSDFGEAIVYEAVIDVDVATGSELRADDIEVVDGVEVDLESDIYLYLPESNTVRWLTDGYSIGGTEFLYDGFDSHSPSISGNGDWVAFVSDFDADGLEAGEPGADPDIFVMAADGSGAPIRVSKTPDGLPAEAAVGDLEQYLPVVSRTGRFIAFVSNATGLDDVDNTSHAVFIYDRDSDEDLDYDEPGGTSMTRVSFRPMDRVHSIDIDDRANAVSITMTLANGSDEWEVFRRSSRTESFSELTSRVRSIGNGANSSTTISANGNRVLVRDGADLYLIDVPRIRSVFPALVPSQGWTQVLSRPIVSDPVNTATGALVSDVTDLTSPAGAPMLSFARNYNSQRLGASVLGEGWRTNWEVTLDTRGEHPEFVNADGASYTWTTDDAGDLVRPDELLADLVETAGGYELAWFSGETWTFDDEGQIAERRSWDGTAVTVSRDSAGRIESLDASTGQSLSFGYDAESGRLVAATLSDGRSTQFGYTEGLLSSVSNPSGSMSYEYGEFGLLVSETDAEGVTMHVTAYDDVARVVRQELATGEVTLFAYDDEMRTTTVTDVESGDVVVYAFDEEARLVSITDPAGNVALSEWNADGLPAGSTDRLGYSPVATYDENGNVTSVTDPVRGTTSYVYDELNRVVSVTEPTGAVTTMTYEGTERIPSSVTDALGNTTSFTIDDGLATQVVDADGVTTRYVYDGQRRMTSMTNGLGNTWTYTYDAVGRQTSSTTPLGHVTSRTFDDAGRLLSSTAADGGTTVYVYDADGRLLSTTDPVGAVTSNTYDPTTGLLSSTTDPEGRVTTYSYNPLGELIAVEANDGGVSETDYGTLGRVTATRDALGRETTYAYDANGNRTEVVTPDGGVTRTEFDKAGRVAALEDPLGRRTTHAYDEFGRLIAVTQPDGTTMSYTYDLLGRQVAVTAPDGGVTETQF